jgi:hypothetical protein
MYFSLCEVSYILNLDAVSMLNVYLKYKLDNVTSLREKITAQDRPIGVRHGVECLFRNLSCFMFSFLLLQ